MPSGEHFQPGIPLVTSPSFTGSDVDTSQSGIRFANGRTMFVIQTLAPTEIDNGPDWDKLIWGAPSVLNSKPTILLNKYDSISMTWVPIPAVLRDRADIPNGSIPVSALYATLLQVGMVPVVTNVLGNAVVQWQTFTPSNIPAGNITPGSSLQFLTTNAAGTGTIWANFVDVLSALGAVIPVSALSQSGATTGQTIIWNGSTWTPSNAYTPPVPAISDAPWSTPSNWLEVYTTSGNVTIRKTRANLFNTAPNDFTDGSLALDTTFIGWPTSNPGMANLFTVQNFLDVLGPIITADAISGGSLVYPKKFATGLFPFTPATPWGFGSLTAGVLHGLGSQPMHVGGRVYRTASNNAVSTTDIPVGSVFNLSDVGFQDNAYDTHGVTCFIPRADSTKIYLWTTAIFTDGGIRMIPSVAGYASVAVKPNILIPIGDTDFSLQLYCYL